MMRRIPRGLILPAVSAGLLIFSLSAVMQPQRMQAAPPLPPPRSEGAAFVAALGTVEPSSEMIQIGTHVPGVVSHVHVVPGAIVQAGGALFTIDDRQIRAAIIEARAAAKVAEVGARDATARAAIYERIDDPRAISADERDRRRYAAELSAAAAAQAQARVEVLETELSRLTVRSPIAAKIWRVNVRPGEFAAAGALGQPLISLGAAGPLHIRAQIDEEDIGRVDPAAHGARASRRGHAADTIALSLVRLEPQARDKRNLSGGSERVDTRVIEAIFRIESPVDLFAGQQLDIFVPARPLHAQAPS